MMFCALLQNAVEIFVVDEAGQEMHQPMGRFGPIGLPRLVHRRLLLISPPHALAECCVIGNRLADLPLDLRVEVEP